MMKKSDKHCGLIPLLPFLSHIPTYQKRGRLKMLVKATVTQRPHRDKDRSPTFLQPLKTPTIPRPLADWLQADVKHTCLACFARIAESMPEWHFFFARPKFSVFYSSIGIGGTCRLLKSRQRILTGM